jgi:hypothetical protein
MSPGRRAETTPRTVDSPVDLPLTPHPEQNRLLKVSTDEWAHEGAGGQVVSQRIVTFYEPAGSRLIARLGGDVFATLYVIALKSYTDERGRIVCPHNQETIGRERGYEGRDGVKPHFAALQRAGIIEREQIRGERRTFGASLWIIRPVVPFAAFDGGRAVKKQHVPVGPNGINGERRQGEPPSAVNDTSGLAEPLLTDGPNGTNGDARRSERPSAATDANGFVSDLDPRGPLAADGTTHPSAVALEHVEKYNTRQEPPDANGLLRQLASYGVDAIFAQRAVVDDPHEVALQLSLMKQRIAEHAAAGEPVRNPGAFLRRAIEGRWAAPTGETRPHSRPQGSVAEPEPDNEPWLRDAELAFVALAASEQEQRVTQAKRELLDISGGYASRIAANSVELFSVIATSNAVHQLAVELGLVEEQAA